MSSPTRLPGLDGLRAAAVVAVVAYHLGYLSGGFLGVDVFFVLSGYLVTTRLLAASMRRNRHGWLRRFWGRRARRLGPALVVLVAAVMVASLLGAWPRDELRPLGGDSIAALTWWANWRHLAAEGGYWAGSPSPLLHTWSLSIEEQFYLLWPLLLGAVAWVARRRSGSTALAVGAAALVGAAASGLWGWLLAGRLPDDELSRVYLGSDTRFVAPLAGCALAGFLHGRDVGPAARRASAVLGVLGAAFLIVAVVQVQVSDPDWYRSGGVAITAVAATALVAWSLRWRRIDPVTSWIGTRSYAIYLWSWPLEVFVAEARPEASRGHVAAIVVPATILAAEASWRFVEQPVLHGSGWGARPALRRPVFAASGVVLAALLVAMPLVAVDPPEVEQLETGTANTAPPPSAAPTTTTAPTTSSMPPVTTARPAATTTTTTAPPPPPRVMVTGDSVAFTAGFHAPESVPGLASIDGRGMIGCGVLAADGVQYARADAEDVFRAEQACTDQREVEAIGLGGRPDLVVTMPGSWEWTAVRLPDGRVVEAQSGAMADLLVDELLERAREAHAAGGSYAIVRWVCPGPSAPQRSDPNYLRWFSGVVDRTVAAGRAEGLDVFVLDPAERFCVGGDPVGDPTPERLAAKPDGVHVKDAQSGAWLWQVELGPLVAEAMSSPDRPTRPG